MNTLDTYINASGKREEELEKAIQDAKSKLQYLTSLSSQYYESYMKFKALRNEYHVLSHDDWKHRNKKDLPEYNAICNNGSCKGQGKTGRGNRFDKRYKKWLEERDRTKGYLEKYNKTKDEAIPAQRRVIQDAENALKSYRQALNDKVAQGHTPESAAEFAENEIQAQEQALLNSQKEAEAKARAIESAPRQRLIKIAVIGGLVLVGGFLLLRLRK